MLDRSPLAPVWTGRLHVLEAGSSAVRHPIGATAMGVTHYVLQAQVAAAQASVDQAWLIFWNLLFFNVGLVAGAAVHEAGHAIMARVAGLSVRMVRIGTGRPLLRCRIGLAWVVIRILPFSGAVFALVSRPPGLVAATGFLLGGMLGNALLLAVVTLAWMADPGTAWWSTPVATAQLLIIIGAARPRTWRDGNGQHRSDGERLRALYSGAGLWSGQEAQGMLLRALGLVGPAPAPSPAWPEIVYQVTRLDRYREAGACQDACAVLRGLVDSPDLTWFERLVVQDELILQEVYGNHGAVTHAELDAWSADAFARAPSVPVRIARAGALCRLGRLDEAEALLGADVASASGTRHVLAQFLATWISTARERAQVDALRPPQSAVDRTRADA